MHQRLVIHVYTFTYAHADTQVHDIYVCNKVKLYSVILRTDRSIYATLSRCFILKYHYKLTSFIIPYMPLHCGKNNNRISIEYLYSNDK